MISWLVRTIFQKPFGPIRAFVVPEELKVFFGQVGPHVLQVVLKDIGQFGALSVHPVFFFLQKAIFGALENVDFAVKVEYLRPLLDSHAVKYTSESGEAKTLSRPDLVKLIESALVMVTAE